MLNVEYDRNWPTVPLAGGAAEKNALELIGLRPEAGPVQTAARNILIRAPSVTGDNLATNLGGLA